MFNPNRALAKHQDLPDNVVGRAAIRMMYYMLTPIVWVIYVIMRIALVFMTLSQKNALVAKLERFAQD